METYANQKIIIIDKSDEKDDNYLQIYNKDWIQASKDMIYGTFKLYLYLASNNDGFRFALSQRAVKNKLGISKAAYHKAIDQLIDMGYLNLEYGNTYKFTTSPQFKATNDDVNIIDDEDWEI